MGSANPNTAFFNSIFSYNNTWYPVTLANAIAEFDLDPGVHDIDAKLNSNLNWYYGTDGQTPNNQYDFVTTVLHELGHGLGFYSENTANSIRLQSKPYVLSQFVEIGMGSSTSILTLADGTPAMAAALTGNNLFFKEIYWQMKRF